MSLQLAVLILLSAAAFPQTPSGTSTLVGTVEGILGTELRLKSGRETIAIQTDRNTQVHKGKSTRGLSALDPGKEISVRCRTEASGKLVAVEIWADIQSFSAAVTSVSAGEFLVSSPRLGSRLVRHYGGTSFSADPKRLAEGQQVFVVGLDVGDSTVDATRVTIYNTDIPVSR